MKKNNKKSRIVSPALKSFAKGLNPQHTKSAKNCVIYTRVSSKEQAEHNSSLSTQKRYCEEFCEKHGYTIKAYFGGTYESAKGDERKEFQKMLSFVRKNRVIDTILVYSYDRFSRSGSNAAFLSQELQKSGVKVVAVSQPVDTGSPSGRFHRDMLYLVGQLDNEMRKDKVVNGMIENLKQGYWVAPPPFGYTNTNKKEKAKNHIYIINEQGELLKEAFRLKAETNLTNKDIVVKLKKKGCTINYKSFVRIISNPFYCGYITHALIPGEIIPGHHPALVSETLFADANRVIKTEPRAGIPKTQKIEALPLKIFAKSERKNANTVPDGSATADGVLSPFTGYIKKGIFYYKSRHKGTAVNVNAHHLNTLFAQHMSKFEYQKKHAPALKERVSVILKERLKNYLKEQTQWKKQLTEINTKIENLEERFVSAEIPKELYDKFNKKYQDEKGQIEQKLSNQQFESSNLEKIIEKGLKISENLSQLWLSGDFDAKQKLQRLVFPDGIVYNKKNDSVRTIRVNTLFEPIPHLISDLEGNEKSHLVKDGLKSDLVARTRIELVIHP